MRKNLNKTKQKQNRPYSNIIQALLVYRIHKTIHLIKLYFDDISVILVCLSLITYSSRKKNRVRVTLIYLNITKYNSLCETSY